MLSGSYVCVLASLLREAPTAHESLMWHCRAGVATATKAAIRFVLFHMGMTGSLVLKDRAVPQYKSFAVSAEVWPPRFRKVRPQAEASWRHSLQGSEARCLMSCLCVSWSWCLRGECIWPTPTLADGAGSR